MKKFHEFLDTITTLPLIFNNPTVQSHANQTRGWTIPPHYQSLLIINLNPNPTSLLILPILSQLSNEALRLRLINVIGLVGLVIR